MIDGLHDLSREAPRDLTTEILIVGSGAGGATAAWHLAAAGRQVMVLEEGGDFTGGQLTQRDGRMYDQLYMERGGRSTADLGITVMQGRVLGGGTVINAADVVPAPENVWRHWSTKLGLTGFSPEAMAPWAQRALDDLSANRPGEDELNRNNRILRDGAQKLGWKGEVMRHDRVGCVGVGTCFLGCPVDAKRNARFVAIPGAASAGAQFFIRSRALKIEGAGGEMKTVRVRTLDPDGYHERESFTVKAKVVILAANAVASAQLLLRSGIGNPHVGQHLSLQPQFPVTAWFPDDDVRFFRGIPQAYAVTEFEDLQNAEHGWWGFRLESIAGTPGIVSSLLPHLGQEGKEAMRRYAHYAAALCLLPDEPVGRIEVEGSGRLRIHYTLTAEQKKRTREAVKAAARCFLAAGAKEVIILSLPPYQIHSEADLAMIDGMSLVPASAPLISAHQQGGVRFAPSPRDGAANPDGEVFGTKDVYVFDSSGFPTSASSHTMTPIMTVSRMLSAKLLTRLKG